MRPEMTAGAVGAGCCEDPTPQHAPRGYGSLPARWTCTYAARVAAAARSKPELGTRPRQRDRGAAIGQAAQRRRDELRLVHRHRGHLQAQPAQPARAGALKARVVDDAATPARARPPGRHAQAPAPRSTRSTHRRSSGPLKSRVRRALRRHEQMSAARAPAVRRPAPST